MHEDTHEHVREITRDALVQKRRNGEAFVLIDVLTHDHFQRVHLPGAVNVPLNLLRDLAPLLFGPHDPLIVYCSNFNCPASTTAAKLLRQLGYTDVQDYKGGILDWEDGNLPVVRGEEEPGTESAA